MQFLQNFSGKSTDDIVTNMGLRDTSEIRWITKRNQSKGTQTDYRDSEAQTVPWEAPYKLQLNKCPEVLTLTGLQWDGRLPIDMHEIKIIKRMRMKKAWESVLPPLDCTANIQAHNAIIAMIDEEEWAFRDKELQSVIDIRMEWMNKMMKVMDLNRKNQVFERLDKIGKYLNQRRNKEINQIERNLGRELRKLNSKYHNKKPTLSNDTKNVKLKSNKDLDINQFKFSNDTFKCFLKEKSHNDDKKADIHLKEISKINTKPKQKSGEFCLRETRWTEEKLHDLYTHLRSNRLNMSAK